jgi:hypothetical protein
MMLNWTVRPVTRLTVAWPHRHFAFGLASAISLARGQRFPESFEQGLVQTFVHRNPA